MSGGFKLQVVHGGGGDVHAAVPAGDHGGHHVDPFHQTAAEQTAVAVAVPGQHDLHLLGAGFPHVFIGRLSIGSRLLPFHFH